MKKNKKDKKDIWGYIRADFDEHFQQEYLIFSFWDHSKASSKTEENEIEQVGCFNLTGTDRIDEDHGICFKHLKLACVSLGNVEVISLISNDKFEEMYDNDDEEHFWISWKELWDEYYKFLKDT